MASFDTSSLCYSLFLKKKWNDMKSFYEENTLDVFLPLNHLGDTALHLAVYSKDMELVEYLLKIVYTNNPFSGAEFGLSLKNAFGNTPLHEAASIGNVALVDLILRYDPGPNLRTTMNKNGETYLYMTVLYGRTKLIKHLMRDNPGDMGYHFLSNTSSMLHEAIRGYYFEIALELLDPIYCLPTDVKDSDGMTCFQLLADIPSAFKSGYSFGILEKLIYESLSETAIQFAYNFTCLPVPEDEDESENNNVSLVNPSRKTDTKHGYPSIRSLRDAKKKHGIVVKLTKILAKDDTSWKSPNTADGQRDSTPLIAAAKNGIIEIVEAILDVFPQAIEHQNHKKENVFHVAAQNHRENVLDLLKSNKFKNPRLIEKFNADGDSILHKAAYKTDISSRERPGEALCLQSDIQWFEVLTLLLQYLCSLFHLVKCNKFDMFNAASEEYGACTS
ncbi:hypothetical protein ABKV19_006998 [Rosa sericea]